MSLLDNLFRNSRAVTLATTGADVNVSEAAPPEENQVLKRGADATHAVWGAAPGGGGGTDTTVVVTGDTLADPEVDHAYYCAVSIVVTLPDATVEGNVGKKITLTFSGTRNLVRLTELESPNSLVNRLGQAVDGELYHLPRGTYVFESVYDPDHYAVGFWVVQQTAPIDSPIDVDYCYPEELPIYTVTPVGTGDRYQLEGTGDSPNKLKIDGAGEYEAGQTLIVPFDTGDIARVAVFKVINNDAPDDWQLESVYLFPQADDLPNETELEYRVGLGEQWGGRRFRTNAKGNALLPQYYVLQRAPLECWPPDGTLLTGAGVGSFGHLDNVVLAGKNNLLDVTGGHTLTLACPPVEFAKGERFAVTVCANGGDSWTIDVGGTDATAISDVDGAVSSTSVSVTLNQGTYIEWQLCADGVWHVVSYIPGFVPS